MAIMQRQKIQQKTLKIKPNTKYWCRNKSVEENTERIWGVVSTLSLTIMSSV